jgi:hypothetical protein
MTTIPMVDPGVVSGKVREIFDAVLRPRADGLRRNGGLNIWRCMGTPPSSWRRTGTARAPSCSAATSRRCSGS